MPKVLFLRILQTYIYPGKLCKLSLSSIVSHSLILFLSISHNRLGHSHSPTNHCILLVLYIHVYVHVYTCMCVLMYMYMYMYMYLLFPNQLPMIATTVGHPEDCMRPAHIVTHNVLNLKLIFIPPLQKFHSIG